MEESVLPGNWGEGVLVSLGTGKIDEILLWGNIFWKKKKIFFVLLGFKLGGVNCIFRIRTSFIVSWSWFVASKWDRCQPPVWRPDRIREATSISSGASLNLSAAKSNFFRALPNNASVVR